MTHLVWSDFDLESGVVTLPTRRTKTGDEASLPIHKTAIELLELLHDKQRTRLKPQVKPFPTKPTLDTWKRSLLNVRIIELVEDKPSRKGRLDNDNLSGYRDDSGRGFDMACLRMTFATLMAEQCIPPYVAQRLMRHSRADLTLSVYTEVKLVTWTRRLSHSRSSLHAASARAPSGDR